jgi:hypothetical protein
MKLSEHMNSRRAFEMALYRVRMRASDKGLNRTMGELVVDAQAELEKEHARLAREILTIRSPAKKRSPAKRSSVKPSSSAK